MKYYLYCLINDGEIFYVGQTKSLKRRIDSHRRRYGKEFSFHILSESKCKATILDKERKTIRAISMKGFTLTNQVAITDCKHQRSGFTLRSMRTSSGLTLQKLSNLCGVSVKSLCLLECGKRYPSRKTLASLSTAYGTSPEMIELRIVSSHPIPRGTSAKAIKIAELIKQILK